MFELDQTSIVPLYKQLKDKIKDAILDGSLKPNQKIPSELELSQTYQISRITVRNAISELVDEELLEKKQGKGTFVCTPKIDVRSPNFTMMCVTNHKVPSSKIIKIVKQPASERDIRELNLAPGAEVIYLLRLLFADGEPVMVEHNFFPERFSKLLETDLSDTSLYAFLREQYGVHFNGASKSIQIAEPTELEAELLGISLSTPMMMIREIVYSAQMSRFIAQSSIYLGTGLSMSFPKSNVRACLKKGRPLFFTCPVSYINGHTCRLWQKDSNPKRFLCVLKEGRKSRGRICAVIPAGSSADFSKNSVRRL